MDFDLTYRPTSYFGDPPTERNSGEVAATVALNWGYLPPFKRQEVDIVHIRLQSVTSDVICIRARPSRHGILYRVVDEYSDAPVVTYKIGRSKSTEPLTMGELIDLIDTTEFDHYRGLISGQRDFMLDGGSDDEKIAYFSSVTSDYYPQLGDYYRHEAEEWLERRKRERIINELDEDLASFTRALRRRRSPPPTWENLPTDRHVNGLGPDDIEDVTRWAHDQNGVDSLTIVPPHPSRWIHHPTVGLSIEWTVSGTSYSSQYDYQDNPTVLQAFSRFRETVAEHTAASPPTTSGPQPTSPSQSISGQGGGTEAEIDEFVQQANQQWYQGDFAEAEKTYHRAAEIATREYGRDDPRVVKRLQDIADSYHAEGHNLDAARIYQEILAVEERTGAGQDETLMNLARAYFQLGRIDQAIEYYQQANPIG